MVCHKMNSSHANPYDTGTQATKDLKRDFGFTAEESISLMALHGIASRGQNWEEATKYNWIGAKSTDPKIIPAGVLGKFGNRILRNIYFQDLTGT